MYIYTTHTHGDAHTHTHTYMAQFDRSGNQSNEKLVN